MISELLEVIKMEIKKIKGLTVALVREDIECSTLTKKHAELFYVAGSYSLPLLNGVTAEFEEALKEEVGISSRRPKKTIERSLTRGSIAFTLKQTPTSNPSYQSIGLRIEQYLEDIQQLNEEGWKREGVRTIDGEAYLLLDDLVDKMDGLKKEYENPGVRTKISYSEMRKEPDLTKMLEIAPGSYGKATGENAKTYRIAKEQVKLLKDHVVSPFKSALKSHTGYSNQHVPDETQVDMFAVGKYVFVITSAPKEDVKYGEAAKKFIKMLAEPEEFTRVRDGALYMPVSVAVEQYSKLVKQHTKHIVQQDIKIMPQPKYDSVLVQYHKD